jgi:hypothetical protein
MTTLAVTSAFHPTGHAFAPHHGGFTAFHPQPHHVPQYRAPAAVQHHNPFEAFASRHHSGAKSASTAVSWRHSESVDRAPAPAPITTRPTPKHRRGAPSHSRTPSTSSEASSGSWRERSRSPAVATVELQSAAAQPKPNSKSISFSWVFQGCDLQSIVLASTVPVYSIADLLRLSNSPLVGISEESQAVVDDLVAHHVWRRGPQSGTPKPSRRRRNGGSSKQRSSSPSSNSSTADDSERID